MARDLVNALIDLLNVQNDFLSVWVDHEVQQLNLDFDLGIMELDGHGLRIEHDQPLQDVSWLTCRTRVPFELPDACDDVDRCEAIAAPISEDRCRRCSRASGVEPPAVDRCRDR